MKLFLFLKRENKIAMMMERIVVATLVSIPSNPNFPKMDTSAAAIADMKKDLTTPIHGWAFLFSKKIYIGYLIRIDVEI